MTKFNNIGNDYSDDYTTRQNGSLEKVTKITQKHFIKRQSTDKNFVLFRTTKTDNDYVAMPVKCFKNQSCVCHSNCAMFEITENSTVKLNCRNQTIKIYKVE